jgi:Tfp pilus assembly protein PilF
MAAGRPDQAVQSLRSALEYDPGQRQTEIELATALAASGKDTEAMAYFNTLLEAEPGNGLINLQLARLAVKQGHEAQAVENYQRALDGTWPGDGYQRRLNVRLELARYLLSRHENWRARVELTTAAGNAPDEPNIKLEIAGLLEQAKYPLDAYEIYRKLALNRPDHLEALEGAARTAAALNHFQLARQYLTRALNAPSLDTRPQEERETVRNSLAYTVHLLALYPAPELTPRERALRILHNVDIARARMEDCSASTPAANSPALAALASRWQAVPEKQTVRAVADDPELEQTMMNLVYDTEKGTVQSCGAPTGEDALLLQIAQAPWAVEQP